MKLEKDYKRKLQLRILDIVKDVDKICRENDIDYYILYGSALGAIRHQGFIPWDDDFDIGMTFDNYVKFLEICEKKLDTTNIVFRLETEFRLNAWGGYFNSTVPPTINAKAFLEKYGEI